MKIIFFFAFVFASNFCDGCYIPPELIIQVAEMTKNFVQRLHDIKDEVAKIIADQMKPPEDAANPPEDTTNPPEDAASTPEDAPNPPGDPFAPFAPFVEAAQKIAQPFIDAAAPFMG